MGLRNLIIKNEYRSLSDDMVQDFYVPLLKEAKLYKRAVGFFSSSALIEISKGLSGLIGNGGRIQLVASPHLSEEDISAIQQGYCMRNEIIAKALIRELYEVTDISGMQRLHLLATLIANDKLDIKIAFTSGNKGIGMYHEKLGIVEDINGDIVAFSGSMNESENAMMRNYEAIDVFCSWSNKDAHERVMAKEAAFTAIWNNMESSIEVLDFPSIKKEIINRYKKEALNYIIDYGNINMHVSEKEQICIGARIPKDKDLYDYQKDAIRSWQENDYCGIFDMATGTGKTLTGLGAISTLSEHLNDKLAVIIICPYQHLVEQWVEDIVKFNINPIIGYSSSFQKDWKLRLEKAIRDQKLRQEKSFFCFICTNATFKGNYVQTQLNKIKSDILIVVDEAHNVGAQSFLKLLDDRFKYRLALSATIERHGDEDGTAFLYEFFGKKCIEYTLERAIAENKLTPYKYYPVVVYLSEEELETYEQLSYEMSKNIIKQKNGKYKLSRYGEILALKRARIVAGAENKLEALREVISPFVNDNNLLVYCGATNVKVPENEDNDNDEMRQIEAVTQMLGNEMGMKVARFTSREKIDERGIIKDYFQKGDKLQALVAIKCLDEGVNIPGIKTAFILASTTNPKEYIQRRGRVLRRAQGKEYAVIYDFITLPRPLENVSSLTSEQAQRDKTLVKNELVRMNEFGRIAMNQMEAKSLIWDIQQVYGFEDKDVFEGSEQ